MWNVKQKVDVDFCNLPHQRNLEVIFSPLIHFSVFSYFFNFCFFYIFIL